MKGVAFDFFVEIKAQGAGTNFNLGQKLSEHETIVFMSGWPYWYWEMVSFRSQWRKRNNKFLKNWLGY